MSNQQKESADSLPGEALPKQSYSDAGSCHESHPNNTTKSANAYSVRSDQPDIVRRASEGPVSPLLGKITIYPSPVGSTSDALNLKAPPKNWWRFALLDAAQKLIFDDFNSDDPVLPIRENSEGRFAHRTAYCRRALAYGSSEVGLVHYPHATGGQESGGFSGLQHCGCVWGCSICGAVISERRRRELVDVIDNCEDEIAMLTLTVQHERSDALVDTLGVLKTAYKRLFYGKSYQRLKADFGVTGRVVGHEVTYGKHGWHPHNHIPLFIDFEKFDPDGLEEYFKQQWTDILHRMGEFATWDAGARLTYGDTMRKDYLVKSSNEGLNMSRDGGRWTLAHEVTKSGSKSSSLSPLRLLAATITGGYRSEGLRLTASQAGRLWLEYVAAFHGVEQLRYCGSALAIRQALRAEQEGDLDGAQVGDHMAYLPHDVYVGVIVTPGRRGELVAVLGLGSRELLQEYLSSLGIDVPVLQPGHQPDICRVRYDLDTDTMTEEVLRPGGPGYEVARQAWLTSQLRGGGAG